MSRPIESRIYRRNESAVFRKTNEAFGGLSNMAPGYPVRVNGTRFFTVEALYQACRFPHLPNVQQLIIRQQSPMTAKMVSKPHRKNSREDWDRVRVKVMRWCLRLKLSQHWSKFSQLLLSTGDRPIVEDSRKDDFWGAIPKGDGTLAGMNVLGRLLMELRETIKQGAELRRVEPPSIPNFLLFGEPLGTVDFRADKTTLPAAGGTSAREPGDELELPLFSDAAARGSAPSAPMATSVLPAEKNLGMIEGLKPYAEYKESGLPWLRRFPAHWVIKRGKSYLTCVDKRSTTGQEELLTVSSARGVVPRSTAKVTMFKAKSYAGYKLCWPGDLVINSLWAWGGGLGVSQHHGIISTAYSVYRPRADARVNSRFLHELVRSAPFNWEFHVRSKGIWISRLQLTDTAFLDAPIPLPPPDEQAAIVQFLDHANMKIDGFIRTKRKLIGLLNEQKRAIIHRAVTRGLDPTVPLKSSGIPWLGDVPKHWEISRVKNEFRCLNTRRVPLNAVERGQMTNRAYDYYGASGVIDRVDDYLFDDELLLIAEDGANLVLRNLPLAIIARGKFWVNNHAHVLKPKRGNLVFLAHRLEVINYAPWITGAAQPKLTQDRLMAVTITVPPPEEQDAIVAATSETTRPLVTAIARTEREIALMQEYRTRLVADVVTGKLDVRSAAANLPDDSDGVMEQEVEEGASEYEEVLNAAD